LAGFQVSIIGRFWVSTEDKRAIAVVAAELDPAERTKLLKAIEAAPDEPPLPEGDFF